MTGKRIALALALLALAAVPYWMPGTYYVNVMSQILFFAIFALGINVLVGHAGLVSLGHAGLFGVASYVVAIVVAAGWGHAAAIVIALAVTMIVTAGFSLLSLRAIGIGFLMITIARSDRKIGRAHV